MSNQTVLCMKCSNPKRGLHNAKFMIKMGRTPVCYQAIDMPIENRHIIIYEKGAEDYARIDPHWKEHDFVPVSTDELEKINLERDEALKERPLLKKEVMPEKGLHIDDFHFHILTQEDIEWAKKKLNHTKEQSND